MMMTMTMMALPFASSMRPWPNNYAQARKSSIWAHCIVYLISFTLLLQTVQNCLNAAKIKSYSTKLQSIVMQNYRVKLSINTDFL